LGITPNIDRRSRSDRRSSDSRISSSSSSRSDSRISSSSSSSSDLLVDVILVGRGVAMIAMDSFDRV